MTDYGMTPEEQDAAIADINKWIAGRPGVIGPFADQQTVQLGAFRLCRPRATVRFFLTYLARVGYAIEDRNGGFVLDVSDPSLLELA